MLETGLKNAQICLAILTVSFPITDVGVLMMMPLYFLFFQVCSKFFTEPTVKGSSDRAILFLKSISERGGSDIERL